VGPRARLYGPAVERITVVGLVARVAARHVAQVARRVDPAGELRSAHAVQAVELVESGGDEREIAPVVVELAARIVRGRSGR
jgi:hypothetical protein